MRPGRAAIAVTAAAAVAAYLVNWLAPIVPVLDDGRAPSPFYHYVASDPLRHGLEVGHTWRSWPRSRSSRRSRRSSFDRRDLAS